MSLMSDINVYKKMISEEIVSKPCPMEYETSEFMIMPKCEDIQETLVVGEEIIVDESMDINQKVPKENTVKINESTIYFKESLNAPESNASITYIEQCPSATIPTTMRSQTKDWSEVEENRHQEECFMIPNMEEAGRSVNCNDINDEQDGDEETIATFVTAAGQQLALYAVEDSEEIFAVAVYDESGEPPTNFQFLMKADVERLIGEGAVRTVKKPTQIKKQLLTTQPPIFFPKDSMVHTIEDSSDKCVLEETYNIREKQDVWNKSSTETSNVDLDMKADSKLIYSTPDKQSDITYLMMDNCSLDVAEQSEDSQQDAESENEIIEQSTVQYILFEGDQSDSELTFDEIQATLQNLKTSESKSSKKTVNKKLASSTNCTDYDYQVHCRRDPNYILNTLSGNKQNLMDSQDLLDTLTNSSPDGNGMNLSSSSLEGPINKSGQVSFKTKRSRKQQLTSVNRDDSEIIIQPASLLNEEDSSVRKRGKRRRRVISHSGCHRKSNDYKRLKRGKHKEVEIIEIDMDEEESMYQRESEVVEITIDDGKDKGSSDKENEIIMVRDSDDESQEADTKLSAVILQCEHCSRNFRQQRALDTHLRVCSKSPSNTLKLSSEKIKHSSGDDETVIKKQYACKVCQQKFDVVVALARHVRSEHSQKKKRKTSKSLMEEQSDESFHTETVKPQMTVLKRTRKKKTPRSSCTWEVKKLSCTDCGRWFPSAALLDAHCLQHGTRKSEQQIRRCQICKKLIKSRLLFIRHLKMHSNKLQNTKVPNTLQKKLRTRQVTHKIMTLRKRGRPRKL